MRVFRFLALINIFISVSIIYYMNYINNMEFYPNILFDEVPKTPIKKLYEVMMKQLNLSHMFTKCNTCLLNNYNVNLGTVSGTVDSTVDVSTGTTGITVLSACISSSISINMLSYS